MHKQAAVFAIMSTHSQQPTRFLETTPRAPQPPASVPALLITIDTECDNAWSTPEEATTENARYLGRFQQLCEKYGFRPSWLTTWEMAHCPVFQEFAGDALRRDAAEVGMHLHAWNSPPLEPLTDADLRHQPYLIEYAEGPMRDKIRRLTDTLEETFGLKMVSHRAGRWAFNEIYARLLVEHGYRVDCSVTPGVSWRNHRGAPNGIGGSDYTTFLSEPYWVDLNDVSRCGESTLMEFPVTILPGASNALVRTLRWCGQSSQTVRRGLEHFLPRHHWLRPARNNGAQMLRVLDVVQQQGQPYAEFMLHSSELMPGGSPRFPTADSIERLYDNLERLFATAAGRFVGMTLEECGQHLESAGLLLGRSGRSPAVESALAGRAS